MLVRATKSIESLLRMPLEHILQVFLFVFGAVVTKSVSSFDVWLLKSDFHLRVVLTCRVASIISSCSVVLILYILVILSILDDFVKIVTVLKQDTSTFRFFLHFLYRVSAAFILLALLGHVLHLEVALEELSQPVELAAVIKRLNFILFHVNQLLDRRNNNAFLLLALDSCSSCCTDSVLSHATRL